MIGIDCSLYKQVFIRGSVNRIKNHIQAHAPEYPGTAKIGQSKMCQK